MNMHFSTIIFPQGCHFSKGIADILIREIFNCRGCGQSASCLRCADGAQRAMRAVQCGCFAMGAHTSLTELKSASEHSKACSEISRSDLMALTEEAAKISGIP